MASVDQPHGEKETKAAMIELSQEALQHAFDLSEELASAAEQVPELNSVRVVALQLAVFIVIDRFANSPLGLDWQVDALLKVVAQAKEYGLARSAARTAGVAPISSRSH